MLFGTLLWLALGGLLLSAGRSGRMPIWARGWSLILHIAAAITVWVVLQTATSDDVYDGNVGVLIKNQLPNIKLFVAGHCNLDAGLTAAEARINKIIAVNTGDDQKQWADFLATLVALHQKE
jgi:hypothetical protein